MKVLLLACLAVLVTIPAANAQGDIRWQWLDGAPEPHEYAFIAPAPSWFDSQKMCKSMGGYLAEVTTKEEDDAIMAYIQDHQEELNLVNTNGRIWLGGSDDAEEGNWVWENSQLSFNQTYTNWDIQRRQPNDAQGNQNCLSYFFKNGTEWDDDTCTSNHIAYVCEREFVWQQVEDAPENHEYAFISPAPSWFSSKRICESMGGYLAEVTSAEEDGALMGYLSNHESELNLVGTNGRVWLGGSDIENEGVWTWAHSKKTFNDLVYTNWDTKRRQPNNDLDNQHCLAYFYKRGSKWDDDTCTSGHVAFICERDYVWQQVQGVPEDHEYAFIAPAPSWYDSVKSCKALGGYLAEIQSSRENKFIMRYLKEHEEELNLIDDHGEPTTGRIWLGASDEAKEGSWVWEHSQTPFFRTYTNWDVKRKQPNNDGGNQNCLSYFYKNGDKWDDDRCASGHIAYICERARRVFEAPTKKPDLFKNENTKEKTDDFKEENTKEDLFKEENTKKKRKSKN